MLIHKCRRIVDFVVDHNVAIAPLTMIRGLKDQLALQVLGFDQPTACFCQTASGETDLF